MTRMTADPFFHFASLSSKVVATSTKLLCGDCIVIPIQRHTRGSVKNTRATYATLGVLFPNKVALSCRALTKIPRQCIREGRLDSPANSAVSFENLFRPRLTNTSATFHDYLILKKKKKKIDQDASELTETLYSRIIN